MGNLPIGVSKEQLPTKIDFAAAQRHMKKAFGLELEKETSIVEKDAPPIKEPYAVATAAAEKMGYKDFSEGSAGRKKRDEIAESLKKANYTPTKNPYSRRPNKFGISHNPAATFGAKKSEQISNDSGGRETLINQALEKKYGPYSRVRKYISKQYQRNLVHIPPRAGLIWNPVSSRWVKENK